MGAYFARVRVVSRPKPGTYTFHDRSIAFETFYRTILCRLDGRAEDANRPVANRVVGGKACELYSNVITYGSVLYRVIANSGSTDGRGDGEGGGRSVTATTRPETAAVLVVDDQPDVADLYATWLDEGHAVQVAYDGEDALGRIDDDVDVVLLDRQMPGITGDDVLTAIADRDVDCRVVMVTAVDPDFDVVEMPFDDYITKPVGREHLLDAIDEMLAREAYDDGLQRYFAMASKKATLETAKPWTELERSEEYREISERVAALEAEAADAATAVDDPESLFRDFPSGE